jgi:transmembrane sensor
VPKTFQQYTVADFVSDDDFLKHQLHPTVQSAKFWKNWLQQNPEKQTEWQQAEQLLAAVRLGLSDYASNFLSKEAEEKLLVRIQQTNENYQTPEISRFSFWKNKRAISGIAAGILLVMGILFWKFQTNQTSIYQEQVALLEISTVEKINQDSKPLLIHLPDGSAVVLSPKSKLSYPSDFGKEDRKIFLSGEATFDVAKDPSKPFFVYANELITKVLGTRFTVTSFQKDKNIIVRVEHGQVSVYKNDKVQKQSLEGVLLLPNQQVVFERQTTHFAKSIIENPSLIEDKSKVEANFDFDETPISTVFDRIEKAYGIDIVFSAEVLKNCQLTASLTEESLFQKLDIITQSIGASYETVEGKIVVSANGCE